VKVNFQTKLQIYCNDGYKFTFAYSYSVEQRAQSRQEQALPRLEAMHAWLLLTRQKTADGSSLAKAIDCSLKRWPAIMRYAASGNLPIDNNHLHAASGMNRIMPIPGLCCVFGIEDATVRRILVPDRSSYRHDQRLSRTASNGSGGWYRVGRTPLSSVRVSARSLSCMSACK
jgi:hypothetical protein